MRMPLSHCVFALLPCLLYCDVTAHLSQFLLVIWQLSKTARVNPALLLPLGSNLQQHQQQQQQATSEIDITATYIYNTKP